MKNIVLLISFNIIFLIEQGSATNSGLTYIEYSTPQNDIVNFGIDVTAGGWVNYQMYPRFVGDFDGDK